MSEIERHKIEVIVARIAALRPQVVLAIVAIKECISRAPKIDLEEAGPEVWSLQALADSLIKIRIFIENNFKCIETL